MTLNELALTLEQLLGQFQLKAAGAQVSADRAAYVAGACGALIWPRGYCCGGPDP